MPPCLYLSMDQGYSLQKGGEEEYPGLKNKFFGYSNKSGTRL